MASFEDAYLKQVHEHSFKNKEEILRSCKCLCFHCFRTYNSNDVEMFIPENDGNETALCPLCITDTLIGDASGFELSDQLIDELAYKYLRGLTRKDMEDFDGPEIVELD